MGAWSCLFGLLALARATAPDVRLDSSALRELRLHRAKRLEQPLDYLAGGDDLQGPGEAEEQILRNFVAAENPSHDVRLFRGTGFDRYGRVAEDFAPSGRFAGRAAGSSRECLPLDDTVPLLFNFDAVGVGPRLDGAAVLLSQEYGSNLWHFLTEALPRLFFVPSPRLVGMGVDPDAVFYHLAVTYHLTCSSEPRNLEELALCLAGRSAEVPHFAAPLLSLFGIPKERFISGDYSWADTVVLPPVPFCAAPNRWALGRAILVYRQAVGATRPRSASSAIRRALVIRRRQRRAIANLGEVIAALKSPPVGAEVALHDVDRLRSPPSILEQFRAFAAADIVVAPQGAGLALAAACRVSTIMIEFLVKPMHLEYFLLSAVGGLIYRGILVEGANRMNSMVVDVEQFVMTLSPLLPPSPLVQYHHVYKDEIWLRHGAEEASECAAFEAQGSLTASFDAERYPWHRAVRSTAKETLYGTAFAQDFIWKSQNPDDCSMDRHYLRVRFGQSGIGSLIHLLGRALGMAMTVGYVLIFAEDWALRWYDKSFCPGLGHRSWECFLQPLSRCRPSAGSYVQDMDGVNLQRFSYWELRNFSQHYVPQRLQHMLKSCSQLKPKMWYYWWHAQAAAYIMRFNADTRRALDNLWATRVKLLRAGRRGATSGSRPQGAIALFVRSALAKTREAVLHPFTEYLKVAERLASSDSGVRVLSRRLADSDAVFPVSQAAFAGRQLFVSTECPRVMRQAFASARPRQTTTGSWSVFFAEENRTNADPLDERFWLVGAAEATLVSLLNLEVALTADAWVCSLSSNWCQLIDELRATVAGKASSPFVNIDDEVPLINRRGQVNFRPLHSRSYTIY